MRLGTAAHPPAAPHGGTGGARPRWPGIPPDPMPDAPDAFHDVPPYEALAPGYDLVMEHVDYADWADYVQGLLDRHAEPAPETVLELGCGTGAFAGQLQPQGPYRYTATDASEAMIRRARDLGDEGTDVVFELADFTDFTVPAPVDVALLLYDGLNYLLDEGDVRRLFGSVEAALRPGGLFVFDQSTPTNSVNNADAFEDEGEEAGFAYVRRSAYDPATRLHTTTFEITTDEGRFRETHVEKAYTLDEIGALVAERFDVVAAYDGFTLDPATDASERVHWVVRRRP